MKYALFAALSLGIANIFSVLMVQAEARGRAHIAGMTEMAYWLANILCIKFAVVHFTVWTIIFCLVMAYVSTYFATHHGHESIDDPTDARQDSEIDELQESVEKLTKHLEGK
jgi:uncharacterized protein YlxW (UPF0749 family)